MAASTMALDAPQVEIDSQEAQANSLSVEEQIRDRAHEIWLQRGSQSGSDISDWLDAEKEILVGIPR